MGRASDVTWIGIILIAFVFGLILSEVFFDTTSLVRFWWREH